MSFAVSSTASLLADVRSSALAVLTAPERERHDRLQRSEDRDDFVAARWLTRRLIGQRKAAGPDLVVPRWRQRCSSCDIQHGRPEVIGVGAWGSHLSWSHSSGIVAAAVACGPVGIDVQQTSNGGSGLGPTTTPALEQWLAFTRAEALVKVGMASLDQALAMPLLHGRAVQDADVATVVDGTPPGWRLTDWTSPSADIVASVVLGPHDTPLSPGELP
jgi:4'-phosphopantetheinyl transferase